MKMERTGSVVPILADSFGRRFEYLRLSLTDVCNFRCTYCLPKGYRKSPGAPPTLSVDEIVRLVRAFAAVGMWKVRLTGGEPSVRPEFLEIARRVKAVSGIRHLAMTTNGYRLAERAADYAAAGIDAINVSIDSLDPKRFSAITGHDRLPDILDGLHACAAAGIQRIKINTVLLRDMGDDALEGFIQFVKDRPISLRFIELMRTNDNVAFFEAQHVPGQAIVDRLVALGWQPTPRATGSGPAVEYSHAESIGRIGMIAPYARDFCDHCNRLRVSASGKLQLCLFAEGGHDLRPFLQADDQQAALIARLATLLPTKAARHDLHQGNSGATPHFASIGG